MDNTASKDLYNLLITRDFSPELLDSKGQPVDNPDNADLFSFDWKTENQNYGSVVILIDDDNQLEIYYGDNLGRSMESDDKKEWYEFLDQLGDFAHRNMLTLKINNINRLKYTMQGMAAIKEGLFEGYYGTKKVSYSDQPKKTRLMIKHSRDLGENDARYRAIESLFVETEDGERFKVPSRNLAHGRMLARHISEGGNPYDIFGQHINQIVDEMHTLAKFIRSTRGRELGEEASALATSAVRHYAELKRKAKHMISQRGYREEREAFNPAQFTDSEVACEAIRDMFIERNIDPRIEEALPILARLAETENKMKEINEFEQWTNKVMEGTWSLPDTPEEMNQLKKLLSEPLIVGPDATNATELLYDLVGDDQLFDLLGNIAEEDPNADVRDVVIDRLSELGIDIDIGDEQNNTDSEVTRDEEGVEENLDVDGVMTTRPTTCSNESVERIKKLALS